MDNKWYSNGLTAEEVENLKMDYAKIENPTYGVNDRGALALQFSLVYASLGNRICTDYQLTDAKDIKAILAGTKAREVSKLEGKIVEAFVDENKYLKGLSINKNLV